MRLRFEPCLALALAIALLKIKINKNEPREFFPSPRPMQQHPFVFFWVGGWVLFFTNKTFFATTDLIGVQGPGSKALDPGPWIQGGSRALDQRTWIRALDPRGRSRALDPRPALIGVGGGHRGLIKALDPGFGTKALTWVQGPGSRDLAPRA